MGMSGENSMMVQNGDSPGSNDDLQKQLLKGQQEQAELKKKVEKLKADIAKRQREAEELEAAKDPKRIKVEESEATGGEETKTKSEATE